jgi:predicted P-loop ATPase
VTVEGVDIDGLKQVVDQLWAEAVEVYRSNPGQDYLWWLSPEEEELREEGAAAYTEEDPYSEAVLAVSARNRGEFSMIELLNYLDIPHNQRIQMGRTLGASCRRLGFVSVQKRVPAQKNAVRVWVSASAEEAEQSEPKFYP